MTRLSIPPEWLNRKLKIALIGCGGTGSEMLDELFRIHSLLLRLGGEGLKLSVYDPDSVSSANIGRQRFWPCDIGFNKAEVLVSRVNSFGNTDWDYHDQEFNVDEADEFDILITCVDKPEVRAEIGQKSLDALDYEYQNSTPTFWLDCGNDSHRGNVIFGHFLCGDSITKIPNVFELYPMLTTMTGNDEPSCSTVEALEKQDYGINRSVAREGANILWQFLRHGSLNYHGSYIDIKTGTVTPLAIDEKVWASFKSM